MSYIDNFRQFQDDCDSSTLVIINARKISCSVLAIFVTLEVLLHYCSRNNVSQAGSDTLAFTFSGAVFADFCNRNNVSQACGHVICPDPTTSIGCDGYLCTCVKNSKYCIYFS